MFKEQAMKTLILIAALSISLVMPLQSSRVPPEKCSTGVLEQARRAFRADDLSQAERLAESIVSCPDALGKEAAQVLTTVTGRREKDRPWQRAQVLIQKERMELRRTIEVAQTSHEARELLDAGESAEARLTPEESLSLQSSGPLLIEMQDSIERERHVTLLRHAVRIYYSGQYTESIAQLKGYLEERPQPPFASFAYFYLGASVASSSLLSANPPAHTLDTAREHFRTGRHVDPNFSPPLEAVSPRLQALFYQAVVESK